MNQETKYFIATIATCLIGITGVLSYANEIDDISTSTVENNAPQTHGVRNSGIINGSKHSNSQYLINLTDKNMVWKKNPKDTQLNNQYYLSNGTSTITKITIGEKVIFDLWYAGKQYSQFNTADEAKKRFNELESQA